MRFTSLNARGIAHHIAPLLIIVLIAVGGTFSVVASHAASIIPTGPTGRVLLFSQQGKFTRVAIRAYGNNSEAAKCGKKRFYDNGVERAITVNLSKSKPVILACTVGTYNVYFLKQGQNSNDTSNTETKTYTAVGLVENQCAFVHSYGISRNTLLSSTGTCSGATDPGQDPVGPKATPVLSARDSHDPIRVGKKDTWTVELKNANGSPLSVPECAGTVTVLRADANRKALREFPLSFKKKTGSCVYQYQSSEKETAYFSVGTFTNDLKFSGNAHLNSVQASYTYRVASKDGTNDTGLKPVIKYNDITPYVDRGYQYYGSTITATVTNITSDQCAHISDSSFTIDSGSKKASKWSATGKVRVTNGGKRTDCIAQVNLQFDGIDYKKTKYKVTLTVKTDKYTVSSSTKTLKFKSPRVSKKEYTKQQTDVFRKAAYAYWNARGLIAQNPNGKVDCLPDAVRIVYTNQSDLPYVAWVDHVGDAFKAKAPKNSYCKVTFNHPYMDSVPANACVTFIHEYGHLIGREHDDNPQGVMYNGYVIDGGSQVSRNVNQLNILSRSLCDSPSSESFMFKPYL